MVNDSPPRGPLLGDVRVVEIGGRGAAVCGQLFAQLGADVVSLRSPGVPVDAETTAHEWN